MLARRYDSYAWEEEFEVTPQPVKKTIVNYRAFRHQVVTLFVVGIICYLGSVMLSETYVTKTSTLVKMKQQEEKLLTKNAALKIDVDALSSPARITGLAAAKLNMTTARSNIYVQADDKKIAYDGYAYAK
ncbi:MAG: hypothetical protein PHH31_01665 [Acidaminococcaceae bacterium]|nr:hypothetical protein [Acidaminococcaceae bacterium]MDD4721151.1 hypothetical protein [Acidaminococcaceae bacterium]